MSGGITMEKILRAKAALEAQPIPPAVVYARRGIYAPELLQRRNGPKSDVRLKKSDAVLFRSYFRR